MEAIIPVTEDIMANRKQSSEGAGIIQSVNLMYILDDMWRGLQRSIFLLPVLVSLFACHSFYRARNSYMPTFEAYASFTVNTRTANGYSETYYNKAVATQMSKTFPYILTSGVLMKVVAEDLGYTGGSVPGSVTAESLNDNPIFTIRVRSSDPQKAYDILQSVVKNYPSVAEYIIGETQLDMIDESGVPTKAINPKSFNASIISRDSLSGPSVHLCNHKKYGAQRG